MYVCVIYMCIYIYMYIYVYICVIYINVCVCVCVYIYIYIIYMFVYMHIIYVYTYTQGHFEDEQKCKAISNKIENLTLKHLVKHAEIHFEPDVTQTRVAEDAVCAVCVSIGLF